jgi:regulator of protease activity HflC (stomatin/prohibitin superfamily)
MNIFMPLIIFGILLLIFIIFLLKSVYLIQQAQALVIQRFGKYDRILGPGIHIIIPFIERPREVMWSHISAEPNVRYYRTLTRLRTIDLRESVHDFPKQNVITKDNVTMEISALLYYQITDPRAAIYEVANLPEAIEKLTQTTLRNVIGSLDLDETLVSRDAINEKLRLILDDAADKWGVKVNRVELQEINPPPDIRHAMEKQMRAERDRRAIILESEGQKQSAILRAQGERESSILRAQGTAESQVITAQGEAEARLKLAEAEAKAIELIKAAVPEQDPLAYLATTQYIKTLPHLMDGKDNKLIVVPYEARGLSGSLAALKKILSEV